MATKKKLLLASAGNAGGGGRDVDQVFSPFKYDGNNNARTIVNGVDLSQGGLVWSKGLDGINTGAHFLQHKTTHYMSTNDTGGETADTTLVDQFNEDGYNLGTLPAVNGNLNGMISWSFKKHGKFFDYLEWDGNEQAGGRAIPHSLQSEVGMVILKKRTSDTNYEHWYVWHRSAPSGQFGKMDNNDSWTADDGDASYNGLFSGTDPSSTHLTVGDQTNQNSHSYQAYLFAHNDGDSWFGPNEDQDIIKCGSFTTPGSVVPLDVDLGFEPQFIMFRLAEQNGGWYMYDTARGVAHGETDQSTLYPGVTWGEFQIASNDFIRFTSRGFTIRPNAINSAFSTNEPVVYMAIRKGSIFPPGESDEVFHTLQRTSNATAGLIGPVGFAPDLWISRPRTRSGAAQTAGHELTTVVHDRPRGKGNALSTTNDQNEKSEPDSLISFEQESLLIGTGQSSVYNGVNYDQDTLVYWFWKAAPQFFDIVMYNGLGSASTGIPHNLNAVPEMVWIKRRQINLSQSHWYVWHNTFADKHHMYLNDINAKITTGSAAIFTNMTSLTDAYEFFPGTTSGTGEADGEYVAYLFASREGISKVGSYTGTGVSQTINCGFSNGARFVLIKKSNGTDSWFVFDAVRGIVTGQDDPFVTLNNTSAEVSDEDSLDAHSTGFTLRATGGPGFNTLNAEYIFYAIG